MTDSAEAASADNLLLLEEALPKLGPALEQRRLGVALRQAIDVLRPFDGQLAQLTSLASATSLLADYSEANRRDVEDVAEEIEELAEEMEEADSQADLTGVVKGFPTLAQRHIPRFHRAVSAMASRYVSQNITSLGTLGRLLVKIGATDVGERLIRLETDAARLPNSPALTLPVSVAAIEQQRADTQAELKALAKDPEVDAFLIALSRGQSSLRLVTPKVLDWLDALDARDQFRVLSR